MFDVVDVQNLEDIDNSEPWQCGIFTSVDSDEPV